MPRQAHCWMKRVIEFLSLSRLKNSPTHPRPLRCRAQGAGRRPGPSRSAADDRQIGFRPPSGTLSVSDPPRSNPSFAPSGHGGPTRPPHNPLGPGQSREAPEPMERHSKYRRLPGTRASPSPAARRAAGPLQERSRFIAGPMRGRHQDPQGSAPPLFRPSQRHFAPFPTVPPRTGPSRNGTGRRTGLSRNGIARRAGRSEAGTGRRIDPPRNGKAPRIPLPERKNGQRITPPLFFPFLSPSPSPFAIGHKEKRTPRGPFRSVPLAAGCAGGRCP